LARPFRLPPIFRCQGARIMKGSRLWGVAALCLLSGSGWLLGQAWPSEMEYPFAGCFHFALIGCVAVLIALRRDAARLPMRRLTGAGIAGSALFVLPAMVLHLAAGAVSESSGVALFCAVPVMTIVGASLFAEEGSRLRGLLLPGVGALGGALLLFPMQTPGSPRGWLLFSSVMASCAVVAAASLWMHRLLEGMAIAAAVAAVGFTGAVVLGLYGLELGWTTPTARILIGELLRCAVFDLPIVWLTVWLIREVNPVRLSARFVLVPLVTATEGYLALHEAMDGKTLLAMAGMLVGGVMLLIKDEPDEVPGLRLR